MKDWSTLCQTGSLWTGPCEAKSRPASQNHLQTREQVLTKIYWFSPPSPLGGGHFVHWLIFKRSTVVQNPALPCSDTEAPNRLGPFTKLFSVTWYHGSSKLVKVCTWEQIWSSGSNTKMAIEKLKFVYKTWTNPQIKNYKKSHKLKLIKPQTQHQSPEHKYLKF